MASIASAFDILYTNEYLGKTFNYDTDSVDLSTHLVNTGMDAPAEGSRAFYMVESVESGNLTNYLSHYFTIDGVPLSVESGLSPADAIASALEASAKLREQDTDSLETRDSWTNPSSCSWDNLANTDNCCDLAYNKISQSSTLSDWHYIVGNCHFKASPNGKSASGPDRNKLAQNMCNWCQHNNGVSGYRKSSSSKPGACMSNRSDCNA